MKREGGKERGREVEELWDQNPGAPELTEGSGARG